jgi:hypothetical protein
MGAAAFEQQWAVLSEEVLSGMQDWRAQPPQASLREIESELDSRLAGMRARMLENLALQRRASAWGREAAAPPRCPSCGEMWPPRGKQTRHLLKTHGGQELRLARTYGVCPRCGQGHFPPG